MVPLPSAKYLILLVYLSTILYVQLRGNAPHKLRRLAADHANVMAPYNALMYLFSAVRARPYADVSQFPELQKITSQWQMIRDKALKLFDAGYIRAAASHNDIGFNTFFRAAGSAHIAIRSPGRCAITSGSSRQIHLSVA